MAIITNLEEKQWSEVQEIIQKVLNNRKLHFNKETILYIIKHQLMYHHIDVEVMNCAYFQMLLLDKLDNFVDNGILYQLDDIYVPVQYMIFRDYDTNFSNLLYLVDDDKRVFVNVSNEQSTLNCKPRDFILIGDVINEEKKLFSCPEIPLDEVISLYQDFIKEGANKKEAINHILNYYKTKSFSHINDFGNVVKISYKKQNTNKKVLKKN